MSTTTNKLAEYLRHNKFMAATIVTGVVALVAITSVVAWDGGSAKIDTSSNKPSTAQKADDKKGQNKDDVAAVVEQTNQTGQVLGDSVDLGSTTTTPQVQTAAPTPSTSGTVVTPPAIVETPVVTPVDPAPVDPNPVDPTPTNTAPVVSITAPAANTNVSNTVAVTANASDDKAVASVQFMLDGVALGAADTTAPYSADWDTKTATNAQHTLTAVATDGEGAKTTATNVVVTVGNVVVTPGDPTKFDKARVSLTFDDGWKSISANGQKILDKYGLKSTQYINSQPTLDGYSGYMTANDIKAYAAAGHEIAWHTNTHTYDLTTATPEQRTAELNPTTPFIEMLKTINVTMTKNFAAPFGTQSAESAAAARAAGFTSYRSTYDGYNIKGATDVMSIKVKNVCGVADLEPCGGTATTPEEVAGWIAQAQADNAWLVIVFHEVAEFSRATAVANGTVCDADPTEAGVNPDDCVADPSYAVTPGNLDAMLAKVVESNIAVQTIEQALSELTPQL